MGTPAARKSYSRLRKKDATTKREEAASRENASLHAQPTVHQPPAMRYESTIRNQSISEGHVHDASLHDTPVCDAPLHDAPVRDMSAHHAPPQRLPEVNDSVEIWWDMDECFYRGTLTRRQEEQHSFRIEYDDGDMEDINITSERWRYATCEDTHKLPASPPKPALAQAVADAALHGSDAPAKPKTIRTKARNANVQKGQKPLVLRSGTNSRDATNSVTQRDGAKVNDLLRAAEVASAAEDVTARSLQQPRKPAASKARRQALVTATDALRPNLSQARVPVQAPSKPATQRAEADKVKRTDTEKPKRADSDKLKPKSKIPKSKIDIPNDIPDDPGLLTPEELNEAILRRRKSSIALQKNTVWLEVPRTSRAPKFSRAKRPEREDKPKEESGSGRGPNAFNSQKKPPEDDFDFIEERDAPSPLPRDKSANRLANASASLVTGKTEAIVNKAILQNATPGQQTGADPKQLKSKLSKAKFGRSRTKGARPLEQQTSEERGSSVKSTGSKKHEDAKLTDSSKKSIAIPVATAVRTEEPTRIPSTITANISLSVEQVTAEKGIRSGLQSSGTGCVSMLKDNVKGCITTNQETQALSADAKESEGLRPSLVSSQNKKGVVKLSTPRPGRDGRESTLVRTDRGPDRRRCPSTAPRVLVGTPGLSNAVPVTGSRPDTNAAATKPAAFGDDLEYVCNPAIEAGMGSGVGVGAGPMLGVSIPLKMRVNPKPLKVAPHLTREEEKLAAGAGEGGRGEFGSSAPAAPLRKASSHASQEVENSKLEGQVPYCSEDIGADRTRTGKRLLLNERPSGEGNVVGGSQGTDTGSKRARTEGMNNVGGGGINNGNSKVALAYSSLGREEVAHLLEAKLSPVEKHVSDVIMSLKEIRDKQAEVTSEGESLKKMTLQWHSKQLDCLERVRSDIQVARLEVRNTIEMRSRELEVKLKEHISAQITTSLREAFSAFDESNRLRGKVQTTRGTERSPGPEAGQNSEARVNCYPVHHGVPERNCAREQGASGSAGRQVSDPMSGEIVGGHNSSPNDIREPPDESNGRRQGRRYNEEDTSLQVLGQVSEMVTAIKERVKHLVARQVTVWLLETPHEYNSSDVTVEDWAKETSCSALQCVSAQLRRFSSYEQAYQTLSTSLGNDAVELSWFLEPKVVESLQLARRNYAAWDPPPSDEEWKGELVLLKELSERFHGALQLYMVRDGDTALQTAGLVAGIAAQGSPENEDGPNSEHMVSLDGRDGGVASRQIVGNSGWIGAPSRTIDLMSADAHRHETS